MFWNRQSDVLVVGAGPVGLMTALMLGERDIPVEVIDEEDETGRPDYLLALHPSSLELLDDHGLANEVVRAGASVRRVAYYFGSQPRAVLRLDALESNFPFLSVLPYDELVRILERHLRARKSPVHLNHRLSQLEQDGDSVKATVERLGVDSGGYPIAGTLLVVEKVREQAPRFVVGADGFHSVARRRTDIELDHVGPPISFAEVEFETDLDLDGEARIVVCDHSVDVLWPSGDGRCHWTVQVRDGDVRPSKRHPPLGSRDDYRVPIELVQHYLAARAPWFSGRVRETEDHAIQVHFQPALARELGRGRVWLAGEAAHVTSPIGAQSLNSGVREAHELASNITRVLRFKAPSTLLAQYDREGRGRWRQLLGLADEPTTTTATDAWVAANAKRLLSTMPATGEHLGVLAAQIGIEVPTPPMH